STFFFVYFGTSSLIQSRDCRWRSKELSNGVKVDGSSGEWGRYLRGRVSLADSQRRFVLMSDPLRLRRLGMTSFAITRTQSALRLVASMFRSAFLRPSPHR